MKYLKLIILEELKKVLNEEEQEEPIGTGEKSGPFNEKTVLKLEDEGDQVYQLQQKLKDLGFLKFKSGTPTGYYGPFTKKAVRKYQASKGIKVDGIAGNITLSSLGLISKKSKKQQESAQVAEKCPPPKNITDPAKIQEYEKLASAYMLGNIPTRSACEIAYIKIRPEYKGRSFFIVDTRINTIYLFDQNGKFIDRSMIVDGSQAQSQNEELIAKAIMSADEFLESEGIERKGDTYINKKTGKDLGKHGYLNAVNKVGTRFMPQGIYNIKEIYRDRTYAGKGANMFTLETLGGKELSNAIHAYYLTDPKRGPWLENIRKKYGFKSGDPAISKEYVDYVTKNLGKVIGGNMSYGCINIPLSFLESSKPYAVNSLVFVLGENEEEYLVKNTQDFFNNSSKFKDVDTMIANYGPGLNILNNTQQEMSLVSRTA